MQTPIIALICASLVVAPAAQAGEPGGAETVVEGTGIGAGIGGILGAVIGGKRGALIGAGIGAAVGTGAGVYVKNQKKKYASIESRIAGEREVVAQAILTANSQIASSQAHVRALDTQIAELERQRTRKAVALAKSVQILANLEMQSENLTRQRQALEISISEQEQFVAATAREVGRRNEDRVAQVAQWKADIPAMREALQIMTAQIASIGNIKARAERVKQANA